jgi:adenosine deaminase
MAMLDYLHGVYPGVHITLHAGEIALGLVKPEVGVEKVRDRNVFLGCLDRVGRTLSSHFS